MPFSASDQTAQWDQNLKTLGGALFPDPSKAAHAYHYGSEARKAQLESNKLIDQGNWRADYGMKTQGGPQPALPTYYTPQNVPGAFPIRNPPSNLPYAGGAPPQAAPAGNLAAIVANSTPAQAADKIEAVIPQFTTGRAASLFGQPTAEAPPSPQATGSDGSTPNDVGVLHPASINTTGGGAPQAPPAQHNGSPASMPPGMTLPGLMALSGAGALAGFDAATIQAGGSALAYELFSRNLITRDQYHQMLGGAGAPQLGVADIGAASAANVANIGARAEITKQNIVTGEGRRQFDEHLEQTVDPVTGKPIFTRRKGAAGLQAYDTATAQQTNTPGQYVLPGKPSEPARTMTAGTAIAQGAQAAATTPGDRLTQQILNTPPGPEQDRLILQARTMASTPKETTPAQQRDQRTAEYEETQRIYAIPQKGYGNLGLNNPSAFDDASNVAIDQRANELSLKRRFTDPTKAREAAIQDLMKNPTADGLRLPTREEVAKQREGSIQARAGQGFYGDPRLDAFQSPLTTSPTPHMMIRMVPKDYTPGAPAKGAAATPSATAAPAAAAAASANFVDPSMPAMPAMPAPTAAAPTAPVAAAPPPVPAAPYTPPGQGFGARIMSIFGGNTPPYVSPRPGQAPAAAPAPAPAAAPTVSGGAPPGALGPAPAGSVEGAPVYAAGGKPVGFNRGGWVFPSQ